MRNIRTGLRETGKEYVDWIHVAQRLGLVGGSCEHDNETSGYIKSGNFLTS
jgi:hypothetical protein